MTCNTKYQYMGTSTGSTPFSIRLPSDIKKDLDYISKATQRSASSIAIKAIGDDVAIRAKRMRMIEESMHAKEDGQYISHEAADLLTEFNHIGHVSTLHDSGEIFEWSIPKSHYILPYSLDTNHIFIHRIFDTRQEQPER